MTVRTAVIVELVADSSGIAVGVAAAKKQLAGLSGAVAIGAADSLAGMRQVGYGMQAIGNDMTRFVTVPVAAAFYGIVKTFSEFEKQMKHVQAITGATGSEFEKLGQKAQDLGLKTQFSAAQVAEGMGILGQAGFTTSQILDQIPTILNLAAAGSMDLASAADVAVSAMYGFGFEIKDLPRVVDGLSAAAIATNTNIANLGHAFKYAGPLSDIAGLQFEEAAAALGLFSNAGIDASMAGTTLRGALSRMLNPPREAAKVMQELGINVLDSEGKLISLKHVIDEFNKANATPGQLMEIFGARPSAGMIALMGMGSDELERMQQLLESSEGSVARIAEIKMQGLAGDMTRLKAAAQGFAIAFAEAGGIDLFVSAIQMLTKVFRGLAKVNPNVLKTIGAIAGLLALGGPLLIFVSRLFLATVRLRGALDTMEKLGGRWTKFAGLLRTGATMIRGAFSALLGPWGLVIAAIALAAYGLYVLYQRSETFRRIVGVLVDFVKAPFIAAFNSAKDAIKAFADGFNNASGDIERTGFLGVMERIGQTVRYVYDKFIEFKNAFMSGFRGENTSLSGIAELIRRIGLFVRVARDRFVEWWAETKPKLRELYDRLKPVVDYLAQLAGSRIVIGLAILVGLIVALVAAFAVVIGVIILAAAALGVFAAWMTDKAIKAVQDFIDKWDDVGSKVHEFRMLFEGAVDDIVEKADRLKNKIGDIFQRIFGQEVKVTARKTGKEAGEELASGVADGSESEGISIQMSWSGIWETIKGIYWDGVESLVVFWEKHGERITQILGQTWDNVVLIMEGGWAIVKGLWDVAFETLILGLEIFAFTFTRDWQALWDAICEYFRNVKTILGQVMAEIAESIGEWLIKVRARWGEEVRQIIYDLYAKVFEFEDAARQLVKGFLYGLENQLADLGNWLDQKLVQPFRDAANAIFGVFGWIGKAAGWLFGGKPTEVQPFTVDPTGSSPATIPQFGGPAATVPGVGGDPWLRSGDMLKRSHNGGVIPGRYMADVPMMMQAGEGVIPVGAMSDVLSAARRINRGSGGGATYNIQVDVAPGTNPTDVGRQIVEAISQYERRNGASWRAA